MNIDASGELEKGDYSTYVKESALQYPTDANENMDLVYEINFVSGALAATSLTVDDEPESPVEGTGYVVDRTKPIIKSSYLNKIAQENAGIKWILYVKFDDAAQTAIIISMDFSLTTTDEMADLIDNALHHIQSGETQESLLQRLNKIGNDLFEIRFENDFYLYLP